jgi:hypothetical protein
VCPQSRDKAAAIWASRSTYASLPTSYTTLTMRPPVKANFGGLTDDVVVDEQLQRTDWLVVLAVSQLGEVHPDDMGAGRGCVGDERLFEWDAEEVVDVGESGYHAGQSGVESRMSSLMSP